MCFVLQRSMWRATRVGLLRQPCRRTRVCISCSVRRVTPAALSPASRPDSRPWRARERSCVPKPTNGCPSSITHLPHLRSTTKLNKSTHAGYYPVCSGSSWPSQMHHFISFGSSELWNGLFPGRVLICSVWSWSRESAEPGGFYEWTVGEICCCCLTFRKTIEIKCIPAQQTRAACVSGKTYCFTFREAECDWERSLIIGLFNNSFAHSVDSFCNGGKLSCLIKCGLNFKLERTCCKCNYNSVLHILQIFRFQSLFHLNIF